jgi:phycocyanin beta chain
VANATFGITLDSSGQLNWNSIFMNDAFIRIVAQADGAARFLHSDEIDELKKYQAAGQKRLDVVKYITENSSSIISAAIRALLAEQPHLVAPGGEMYTNRKMAACLRDMEIILRYVTYAMFVGDASVLKDRCLNGLRETYVSLGVPGNLVVVAIQRMKEAILNPPPSQQEDIAIVRELEISEIREAYPRQWVTIEVTEYRNGLPCRGKVLYHNHNIADLTKRTSHLDGKEIYTFFSSRIDSSPAPIENVIDRNSPILSPGYQEMLVELSSYFDIASESII